MGTQANRSLKVWPGNSDSAGHFTAHDRLTLGLLFDTALEEAKAGDALDAWFKRWVDKLDHMLATGDAAFSRNKLEDEIDGLRDDLRLCEAGEAGDSARLRTGIDKALIPLKRDKLRHRDVKEAIDLLEGALEPS